MSEELPQPVAKPWYVYLVRAANGSLYCGISDDPQRRFVAHQKGQGARYFKTSPAQALVYVEQWPNKGEALRQERLGEAAAQVGQGGAGRLLCRQLISPCGA